MLRSIFDRVASLCRPTGQQGRQASARRACPGLEALEDRRLMTAGITASPNGYIILQGTNSNDMGVVTYDNKGTDSTGDDQVVITLTTPVGAWTQTFQASAVTQIVFIGGNGQNTFVNNSPVASSAYGGNNSDVFIGGSGADILEGRGGTDTLKGRRGNDELVGGEGDDILEGGSGNDDLHGGAGHDDMWGNYIDANESRFEVAHFSDNDFMYGEGGWDKMYGGRGNDHMTASNGDDQWGDTLYGGTGDDYLFGGAGSDDLWGEQGNDFLAGGDGDDYLFGGAGSDTLIAGEGYDHLWADNVGTIYSSVNVGGDILIYGDDDEVHFAPLF